MPVTYCRGDLFLAARTPGVTRVIAHVVNDVGGWGSGFTRSVSRFSPLPAQRYRSWAKGERGPFLLGMVQVVNTQEPHLGIINMLCQHGYSRPDKPALSYLALDECLRKLASCCDYLSQRNPKRIEILMPRIGCGLAGGTWDQVEPLIEKHLAKYDVYVYDLK